MRVPVHPFTPAMNGPLNKRQQARNEKVLQDLVQNVPGNNVCADCQTRNPGQSPSPGRRAFSVSSPCRALFVVAGFKIFVLIVSCKQAGHHGVYVPHPRETRETSWQHDAARESPTTPSSPALSLPTFTIATTS